MNELVFQIGIVGVVWILTVGIAKEPGIGWALAIFVATVGVFFVTVYTQVNYPELFETLKPH